MEALSPLRGDRLTHPPAIAPAAGSREPGDPARAALSFAQLLREAVQNVDRLQQAAEQRALALASGQPVDVHEVALALEQASLALQLAVQVRNKLVEAYQEIARMQV